MAAPTFDPTWEALRRQGQALPRYPYDFVVVFVHRYAPKERARSATKVLELGSGAGNNLWFAAREGFAVTGIDGSASAIDYARRRFAQDGLAGTFDLGDFTRLLPYPDDSFDLVFDCGSLISCGLTSARQAVAEAGRVRRPGGHFLFNPYSTRHSCYANSDPGADGLRVNVRGAMAGVGQLCYYTRGDVEATLGRGWDIASFEHW